MAAPMGLPPTTNVMERAAEAQRLLRSRIAGWTDDELREQYGRLLRYRCKEDPYFWLTNACWTIDPHTPQNPVKLFPKHPYLKAITREWARTSTGLAIAKSRQMMITWWSCAMCLHVAMHYYGSAVYVQAREQDQATRHLKERILFMWERMPEELKRLYKTGYSEELKLQEGAHVLKFPQLRSFIRAIPQGKDKMRGEVATVLFMDEAAAMPEARGSWVGAKPTIEGGGRVLMVSSAGPGFFEEIMTDRIDNRDDALDVAPRMGVNWQSIQDVGID